MVRWNSLVLFSAVLIGSATASIVVAQDPVRSKVDDYLKRKGATVLQQLKTLVELPNVSREQKDVRKNAQYLVKEFEKRGAKMELLEVTGANPAIYGEIRTPNAKRTILIYIHYDGQPVDPARWKSTRPFEPKLYSRAMEQGGRPRDWPKNGEAIDEEWRVYGRSTSDDKAPLIALLNALDCLKESEVALTSNIKFFFDGEEEIGSPNMKKTLDAYAEKFRDVDLWLFCDGPLHQSRKPTVYFGVRGICGFELTVYGATRNLHSGHYGNWAPNPGLRLSKLLASMKDAKGNVVVMGFHDSMTPLTEEEKKELAAVPAIDDSLRRELGLKESDNENESYLARMQIPSLNVKGIRCGTVGPTARNIVPNTATASLDIRLVKGNRPRAMIELIRKHMESQGYLVVDKEPSMKQRRENKKIVKLVTTFKGYPAARTPMNHAQIRPVVRRLEECVGDEKLLKVPGLGGSLPLYLISDYLEQPIMIVPMANHDNNQHSPDENLRVGNLFYGVRMMAALLTADPLQKSN